MIKCEQNWRERPPKKNMIDEVTWRFKMTDDKLSTGNDIASRSQLQKEEKKIAERKRL